MGYRDGAFPDVGVRGSLTPTSEPDPSTPTRTIWECAVEGDKGLSTDHAVAAGLEGRRAPRGPHPRPAQGATGGNGSSGTVGV